MANQTEKRDVIITLNNGQAVTSIKELEAAQRKLNAEWRKAATADDRKRIGAELRAVRENMAEHNKQVVAAKGGYERLSSTITKLGGIAAGIVGLQMITQQFGNLIRHAADLSDAQADVQKTTGLTRAEIQGLEKDLKGIDTRSSRTRLLELARDAGKLGITGKEAIREFVEEADKIDVALGEDLGEGAIKQIGKLANVFKTSMLNIASAINTAGASSEASEAYLVDFLARLGGISETAKISAGDIIGYGATLDSLGLQAEMSSTALNNFFIEFLKNTEQFGAAAGFAEGELSKLIGSEGTNAGFIAFLTKLREMNPEADAFLKKLESLGIDGARGSQVFLALSNNLGTLAEQQGIANTAFAEGTSVLEEFNTKNSNFAANLEKVNKFLFGKFMSSSLVKAVEDLFNWSAKLIATPVSEKMNEERIQLNVLVGRILEYNVGSTERVRLIKELQTIHPDLLKGLKAEEVTNQDLTKALKETNEQMVNRILIQRKGEAIAKQNEKTVDNLEKKLQAEADLREQLQKQAEKYNVDLTKYGTLQEKVNAVLAETAKQQGELVRGRLLDEATNDNYKLADAVKSLNFNSAAYNKSLKEQNALTQERADLMKQLGIEDVAPSLSGGGQVPTLGGSAPESPDAQAAKAAEKAWEEFVANTKKLREEWREMQVLSIIDVYEKERAQIEETYEAEVKRVRDTVADEIAKAEVIDALGEKRQRDLQGIDDAIAREKLENARQMAELMAEVEDMETAGMRRRMEAQVEMLKEGTEERFNAAWDLTYEYYRDELESTQYNEEEKLAIYNEYLARRAAAWEDFQTQRKASEAQDLQDSIQQTATYADAVMDIWNTINQIYAQQTAQQLKNIDASAQKEQDDLKARFDAGLMSQNEFNKRSKKIQDEADAKKRAAQHEQFERERGAKMAQATINTIVAVTENMGNYVLAAITAAAGAAQIAIIASEPNPYAKGGRTRVRDSEGNTWNANQVGSFANGGRYSSASLGIIGERGEELVVPNSILNHPDYADAVAHIERGISGGYNMNSSGGSTRGSALVNRSTASGTGGSGADAAILKQVAAAMDRNTAAIISLQQNGVQGVFEWQRHMTGMLDMERSMGKTLISGSNGRQPGERP